MSTKTSSQKFNEEFGPFSFGEIFKSHREADELSQTTVARMLKVSRQNICDLEKGRWMPSAELVEKFAKKLGYSPTVFLKYYFEEVLKKQKLGKYKVEIKVG